MEYPTVFERLEYIEVRIDRIERILNNLLPKERAVSPKAVEALAAYRTKKMCEENERLQTEVLNLKKTIKLLEEALSD
jgi:hypothetical protein